MQAFVRGLPTDGPFQTREYKSDGNLKHTLTWEWLSDAQIEQRKAAKKAEESALAA